MSYYPLNHATRKENDLELQVIEGALPDDIHGYVFVNSPAGTVNHQTPAPRKWPNGSTCQEHGAPLINGDGMVYRFDLNGTNGVSVKNRLLRTACFYADEATAYGSNHYKNGLHFTSFGLARAHKNLGLRNQLNTAFCPLRFRGTEAVHLAATFDAGRPFLINPKTLETITPVGQQQEWMQEHPDEFEEVFPMTHSSAHPSFDAETQEFFTVNFQKSLINQLVNVKLHHQLRNAADFLIVELEKFAEWITGQHQSPEQLADSLRAWLPFISAKHKEQNKKEFKDHYRVYNTPMTRNEVRVLRWKGGKLNSWRVIDESNDMPISITQSMHQTGLTEDYILLSDTTLKFAMDMLQSLPFGDNPKLNGLLRKITTHTIKPITPCYIIKRQDLLDNDGDVKAKRFDLDIEMIHFSLNYQNPNGIITLHATHNSATCGGEWTRPYDTLATTGQPVFSETIGQMAASTLDIGRIGKHFIDAEAGDIMKSVYTMEKGFEGHNAKNLQGPHTWGIGLHTFRNQLNAKKNVDEISQVYYQFLGLDETELTQFIYDLYKDYNKKGREFSAEEMLEFYKAGVPAALCRHNTSTMELEDHYFFANHETMRSLQFVPRKRTRKAPEHTVYDSDGYIFCLMHVADATEETEGHKRQVYIFDAAELATGPLCKLGHDDLAFGFTIHSTFLPELDEPDTDYKVSEQKDCEWIISKFPSEAKREAMRQFMEAEVYPKL